MGAINQERSKKRMSCERKEILLFINFDCIRETVFTICTGWIGSKIKIHAWYVHDKTQFANGTKAWFFVVAYKFVNVPKMWWQSGGSPSRLSISLFLSLSLTVWRVKGRDSKQRLRAQCLTQQFSQKAHWAESKVLTSLTILGQVRGGYGSH